MAMKNGKYEVWAYPDGTIEVRRWGRNIEGVELDEWVADMEQRIAQARSHT